MPQPKKTTTLAVVVFFVHVTADPSLVACVGHATRFACPPQSDTRLRGGGKAGHIRGANILVPATTLRVVVFFVHVTADPSLVACVGHATRFACPPQSDTRLRGGGKAGHIRGANILVPATPLRVAFFCPRHCGSEPSRVRSHATRFACPPQSDTRLRGGGKAGHIRGANILVPATPLRVAFFIAHLWGVLSRACP